MQSNVAPHLVNTKGGGSHVRKRSFKLGPKMRSGAQEPIVHQLIHKGRVMGFCESRRVAWITRGTLSRGSVHGAGCNISTYRFGDEGVGASFDVLLQEGNSLSKGSNKDIACGEDVS